MITTRKTKPRAKANPPAAGKDDALIYAYRRTDNGRIVIVSNGRYGELRGNQRAVARFLRRAVTNDGAEYLGVISPGSVSADPPKPAERLPGAMKVFVAEEDIPELGAKKGWFILDDGGDKVAILHEMPRAALTATIEREKLMAAFRKPNTGRGA